MPTFEIRLATCDEVHASALALFAENFDESGHTLRGMGINFNEAAYKAIEATGQYFIFAAYRNGKMVGYSGCYVTGHMHDKSLIYASSDVLFVAKTFRNSRLGLQLFAATEAEAINRGAKMITWHARPGTAMAAILSRKGYAIEETVYVKGI